MRKKLNLIEMSILHRQPLAGLVVLADEGIDLPEKLSTQVLHRTAGFGNTSAIELAYLLAREVVRLQRQLDGVYAALEQEP